MGGSNWVGRAWARRPSGPAQKGIDRVVGRPCGASLESSGRILRGPGVHEKLLGSSGYGNRLGPNQAIVEDELGRGVRKGVTYCSRATM